VKKGTATRKPAASATASRRLVLGAMLGLHAAGSLYGSYDGTMWRAYEAVEEAWIRDRFELVIQHAPAALNAARVDLELKLVDLQRRGIQYRHLLATNPSALRGGVWQLTELSSSEAETSALSKTLPEYRKHTERIRQMTVALRSHPQYEILRRAQIRLWKTPQYREIHRKYMGRMQELQNQYGQSDIPPLAIAN
jgi:hypothetical protein